MPGLIGLFGGTFDPIHLGHLQSVSLLDKVLGFNRVYWVLSARPPHKESINVSIEHRYAMLQLVLQNHSNFVADDTEIARADKSYTYTTVESFRERYPEKSLCLIIGGDSLHNLHTWYRYEDLLEQVNLIVMQRPGYTMQLPSFLHKRQVQSRNQFNADKVGQLLLFRNSDFDVSSTKIRNILAEKKSSKSDQILIKNFLPQSVTNYIEQHKLYK